MFVNVIDGGDFAANALIYKQPDISLTNYISEGISSLASYGHALSDKFKTAVQDVYNKYNSSDVIAASKQLLHNAGMHFRQDVIHPLNADNMISANLVMQQYIIANPLVNDLYNKNMCAGFPDTYLDTEPDARGKDRYEYQRVMDGVMQFDSDGDGYVCYYSNTDPIIIDDIDKMAILDTWDYISNMVANGFDPTDPDGGKL